MKLARVYAVAFGVVYTFVGLVGFAVASTLATATLIIFPATSSTTPCTCWSGCSASRRS